MLFVILWGLGVLHHGWQKRLSGYFGGAEVIWYSHKVPDGKPHEVRFSRIFKPPVKPLRGSLYVWSDLPYELFWRGKKMAKGKPGLTAFTLDLLPWEEEISITLAFRTPDGLGGFLASMDLEKVGFGVWGTDRSWEVEVDGKGGKTVSLGTPPIAHWKEIPPPRKVTF